MSEMDEDELDTLICSNSSIFLLWYVLEKNVEKVSEIAKQLISIAEIKREVDPEYCEAFAAQGESCLRKIGDFKASSNPNLVKSEFEFAFPLVANRMHRLGWVEKFSLSYASIQAYNFYEKLNEEAQVTMAVEIHLRIENSIKQAIQEKFS